MNMSATINQCVSVAKIFALHSNRLDVKPNLSIIITPENKKSSASLDLQNILDDKFLNSLGDI